MKAVRYRLGEVSKALEASQDVTSVAAVYSKATLIYDSLRSYEFVLSLVTWYDIPIKVNAARKTLVSNVLNLLTSYWGLPHNGFASARTSAKKPM